MNMKNNLAYLVYELSTLDYICQFFLNGILVGASMSYGHFFLVHYIM